MKPYQQRLADLLAESGALFFADGLKLKDGRPTPYFVNLGKLNTGRLINELGGVFADWMVDILLAGKAEVVVGPSYKGSALAQAAVAELHRRQGIERAFDYDRKEAKTHGEATGGKSMFVTGALKPGSKVLIVDDVATSMATKVELVEKLAAEGERLGKPFEILGVAIAMDRQQTQAVCDEQGRVVEGRRGDDAVAAFKERTGLAVWSILGIREAVRYLADNETEVLVDGSRRSLDAELVARLEDYLAVYGRQA